MASYPQGPKVQDHDSVRAVHWDGGALRLLDQRLLPDRVEYLVLEDSGAVAEAIRSMVVRGAPAIGITAAYAVVLAVRHRLAEAGRQWREALEPDLQTLAAARPTAVNLTWAIEQMRVLLDAQPADPLAAALQLAERIHSEDVAGNRQMGRLGAALIAPGSGVLTHCNTGSLATGGFGTALGVIRSAWGEGRLSGVFADETRPWLQGSRLTAWELAQDGIPVTLICEAAAASLMARGRVQWVVVGADRIAANGDVANKIGTYALAVLARHHGLRFMVAAPTSTLDLSAADGAAIAVEERPAEEILHCGSGRIAPEGTRAWNPVFDVTPAGLIDAIVTERGVVEQPGRGTAQFERWLGEKI
jgi:methylthioribose-1-phosphate isomerase